MLIGKREADVPLLKSRAEFYGVPDNVADSLIEYTLDGIPVGGFLEAVLSNDLMEAFGRADEINRARLFPICQFVYNELPRSAWGSREKFREWQGAMEKQRTSENPGG